jgi:adenylate kinase
MMDCYCKHAVDPWVVVVVQADNLQISPRQPDERQPLYDSDQWIQMTLNLGATSQMRVSFHSVAFLRVLHLVSLSLLLFFSDEV